MAALGKMVAGVVKSKELAQRVCSDHVVSVGLAHIHGER